MSKKKEKVEKWKIEAEVWDLNPVYKDSESRRAIGAVIKMLLIDKWEKGKAVKIRNLKIRRIK